MRRHPPLVQNRPGDQEHGLHVKNDEHHGNDIKPHRVPPSRVSFRRDPAFIRLQFCADVRGRGANELCRNERHCRKRDHQCRINQYREVLVRHGPLTRSILPSIRTQATTRYFSNSSSPARLVAFSTALFKVTRSLPSSTSRIPSIVQPAAVVPASLSKPGWCPVSRTALPAPFFPSAARSVATRRGVP